MEQHDSPGHLEWATQYVDEMLDDVITCVVKDVPASWPSHSSTDDQPIMPAKVAVVMPDSQSGRAAYNLLAHSPSMGTHLVSCLPAIYVSFMPQIS